MPLELILCAGGPIDGSLVQVAVGQNLLRIPVPLPEIVGDGSQEQERICPAVEEQVAMYRRVKVGGADSPADGRMYDVMLWEGWTGGDLMFNLVGCYRRNRLKERGAV